MLQVAGLTAQVGGFQLGPVDLEAGAGDIVAVLGENGSGKTTFFRALLGEVLPVGTASAFGLDLTGCDPKLRAQKVAAVPQIEDIPFHFTVLETVLMGTLPHHPGRWESPESVVAARHALEQLSVDGLADRPLRSLSGGERQRALIARALVQQPDLLLMDEPTAHVDLATRALLLDLIPQLAVGRVVAITTHDIAFGTGIGSRCLLLKEGAQLFSGDMEHLGQDLLESCFGAKLQRFETTIGRTAYRPAD